STYKAALDSAQATQAKAEANLAQASALVERYQPLQAAKAISPQEFLNAQVAQRQAQADVASAKAAVQTARINLGYASVTAPISGRIGRALVTEGALVGQGEATQLALVQQVDSLYVNFTQSANDVIKLQKAMESGAIKKAGKHAAAVRVVLDDGTEYPLEGKLLFQDLSVDPSSGQVSLRAELPNPKGQLLPGMYVRVRLEQAQVEGGLLLPQQAVTRGSQGDIVMVVDAEGKVSPRPIKLGGARGNQWVVLSGLKAGEQVMVDGFQKMMNPKAPVKAVPWTPSTPGAAPVASAASSAASR
ncbi:MAG TPA: efflux RND transporter periplasmic adaptor subunit, partial [Aquabacterium sp.]|nr:efflux RND transporter periplasmic adaptor subunit [Aquabacterium sp.]